MAAISVSVSAVICPSSARTSQPGTARGFLPLGCDAVDFHGPLRLGSLYAEVARIPGLIDTIGRENRVLVMGPTLFPALLRTIHLGFVTLALEHKADQIRDLLGATRTEMLKMDDVLERLARQAGTFTATIDKARIRTRAVGRKLRGVEQIDTPKAETLLELAGVSSIEDLDEMEAEPNL